MTALIPRTFHFVFGLRPQPTPFHLLHYLCLESCIQVNRPETVNFHYRHLPWGTLWDRIRDKLVLRQIVTRSFVDTYEYADNAIGHYRYAHESDFVRLEVMMNEGGVYADMDTLFVNPLPDCLFEQPFVLGREQDFKGHSSAAAQPSLCNAFIMSRPGSEFGRFWLERMHGAFDGSWSAHSCQLPEALSRERPDSIHIEPARSFYKHACTVEGIRMLFEGCDPDFEGVYSMHLWHHMWGAWWRRDHTRFHEAQLTENYLRQSATTYSLAAGRFLESGEGDDFTHAQRRPVNDRVHAIDHCITRAGLLAAHWGGVWGKRVARRRAE